MCTGFEIAALALTAGGTAATLYAQDTSAKQQAANLKFQADQAEADARAEAGAAQVEAERIRKQAKSQRAQAVAAAAASGIDVSSPTALKISENITKTAEEDAFLTIANAGDTSARLQQQATADRYSASATRSAGRVNQAATLLSSAASMSNYSNSAWKRARSN